jgi:hypothetical protein
MSGAMHCFLEGLFASTLAEPRYFSGGQAPNCLGHQSCHSKALHTGSLHNRKLLLTVPEAKVQSQGLRTYSSWPSFL